MIKIGIDGRTLQGNLSEVGRYVFELCKELDRLIPNAVFFVYSQTTVKMLRGGQRVVKICVEAALMVQNKKDRSGNSKYDLSR